MKSLLSSFLIVSILFYPYTASAKCDECIIAIIKEGKKAPFDGFLYNNAAYSDTQAERKILEARLRLKYEKDFKLQALRFKFATSTITASRDAWMEKYLQIVPEKNRRIEKLENQVVKSDDFKVISFFIGTFVGICLTVATAFALSQVPVRN